MDNAMFCYQCEQTLGGKGCVKAGVCGKDAKVSALQDLLVYQLKGIGWFGQQVLDEGGELQEADQAFVIDGLFSILTNVNFDSARFEELIIKAEGIKEKLLKASTAAVSKSGCGLCPSCRESSLPASAAYRAPVNPELMYEDAKQVGIMADGCLDENIRSLRELLIYGLKGMAAYAHHAAVLGKKDKQVSDFFFKALSYAVDDSAMTVDELINLNMELGKMNFRCMELLDEANTGTYGHPVPTRVAITHKKGPFIVISGHDLKDLKQLLEQTEGMGINIYTHGEMLPGHAYPKLKRHTHLAGNFGGAWQDQQKEFDGIKGSILMTTNCLQKPRESYKDRIFTTSIVGWPDIAHIGAAADGRKDFSPLIKKALKLGGWTDDEPEKTILVGFGHNATLSNADKI
ncbi:MAG: hydroxylamine reductase, partial [Clostridiales bacterium]|nr:hydroxylamine reductase [Clostridiales bacterium]